MTIPSITATNMSNILSGIITHSHSTPVSNASIECVNHAVELGDSVVVQVGYEGALTNVFRGYVKQISRNIPSNTYNIELSDKLVRAVDYFIASDSAETPYTFTNITAESLVGQVLAMAGITNYSGQATYFTFGVSNPIEVNLVSSMDYCNTIAETLTYSLWYDPVADTVYFKNRKPYPMYGDSGQINDVADTPLGITISEANGVLSYVYTRTERDLRNKVVVYGANDITAIEQAVSPYLPAGFYKTAVIALPTLIGTQALADSIAEYNLSMYNRLTYNVNCSVPGNVGILPRNTLMVNLPDAGITNEQFYIYTVTHSISTGGFTTELELRR